MQDNAEKGTKMLWCHHGGVSCGKVLDCDGAEIKFVPQQ
jgi:hypothetical protein